MKSCNAKCKKGNAECTGLSAETVEGAALPLEGVDHVHGGDGLPLGVLGVGHGVADHVLEEDLEDAPGLLVDEAGDPLDAAPPGEAPDGGLGDALGDRRSGRPTDRRLTWMLSRRTLRCLLAPPLPSPLPPLPRPVISRAKSAKTRRLDQHKRVIGQNSERFT